MQAEWGKALASLAVKRCSDSCSCRDAGPGCLGRRRRNTSPAIHLLASIHESR